LLAVALIGALRSALDFANDGFVDLYDLARAAHGSKATSPHCFADTVHHEPSGLVSDSKCPVQLMGAKALLARIEQENSEPPLG
jgi:hypothetical protein